MKSGNLITMKFDTFSIDKLSGTVGNREMTWKNPSNIFTIDINEIECVIIKKVLF